MFSSKAQQRKCYALKAKGENGTWDCKEWSDKTDQKSLPEKAPKKKKLSILKTPNYGYK